MNSLRKSRTLSKGVFIETQVAEKEARSGRAAINSGKKFVVHRADAQSSSILMEKVKNHENA